MNIYDTWSVLLRVKYQIAPYFVQTNFLAPAAAAKTELKLQSQLLKQKHPLPWPECLMLWSAIFYHSNTNVCHNLCQLRDEIINFFSVSVIKSPRNGQWPLAPVAGWWPRLCVVPGLPPDISIRAWPDHCTMEYLKGRDGHLFHELNKHFLWTFWAFLTRMRVLETYILPKFPSKNTRKGLWRTWGWCPPCFP